MKRTLLLFLAVLGFAAGTAHAQKATFAPGYTDPNPGEDSLATLKRIYKKQGGTGGTDATDPAGQSVTFANPTTTVFRNTAVGVAPVTIKATGGTVYAYNLINPNTTPVFLKFYDSAAPVVGTTVPTSTVAIPANGAYVIVRNGFPHGTYATAIKVAVTANLADTDTTAPATGILVQLAYQ